MQFRSLSAKKNSVSLHKVAYKWLIWVVVVAFLISGCAGAQQTKVYHIGILSGSEAFATIADGFKAKMTELGYVEGKNVVYDLQKLNDDRAGEKRITQKFVADKVDLMFVFPTDPAIAAKAAAKPDKGSPYAIPVLIGEPPR